MDYQTTGSTTITVKTTAGGSTGIEASRGNTLFVFCDGTNVKLCDSGNVTPATKLVIPGSIVAYAGTSAPTGYLFCNGSAVSRTTYATLFAAIGTTCLLYTSEVSRTTYATLFAAIGTTWGAGDGLTTFNVPDLQNMFVRGSGASAVGVYEADTFKSHTHSVTDPGHNHSYFNNPETATAAGGPSPTRNSDTPATTGTSTTGISIQNTGDTETRPVNKRVLYIIKT